MTDHRVTDLSYGLLGKASYDSEEKEWTFSVDLDQKSRIGQISPLSQCLPEPEGVLHLQGSIEVPTARSQKQWLQKLHPEVFPATSIATTYARASSLSHKEDSNSHGSLLAAGFAYDRLRFSGSLAVTIIAIPGPDGDSLRLIRPRSQPRGWVKKDGPSLEIFEFQSPDHGNWFGIGGGIIHQIVFSGDEDERGNMLAVRQDRQSTIFRPLYDKAASSRTSRKYHQRGSPSQLKPNPIACLSISQTSSTAHKDIAFNPWYSRQIAVVDSLGKWSIWDIEKPRNLYFLKPGKFGEIYNDLDDNLRPESISQDRTDDWHRIMWICNINTLLICNRRHVAIFNIKGSPIRIRSSDIFPTSSKEWILDIKLCPANKNHAYILTTTRIFWIEVDSDDPERMGIRVILSYRHFRDGNDGTIKIMLIRDEKGLIMITSEKTPLINYYFFRTNVSGSPTSWKGSLTLVDDNAEGQGLQLLSLCFLPSLLQNPLPSADCDAEILKIEPSTKFLQALALSPKLALSSALFTLHDPTSEAAQPQQIIAPTIALGRARRRRKARIESQDFVVSDGVEETIIHSEESDHGHQSRRVDDDGLRFSMNWRIVFDQIFASNDSPIEPSTMPNILSHIIDQLQVGVEKQNLPASTLAEITHPNQLTGDFEKASSALLAFLGTLQLGDDPDFPAELIMSNLSDLHDVMLSGDHDSQFPDLVKIYDRLIEIWLASLSIDISNAARGAKFKIIRQLAFDLGLSSFTLSLQDRASCVRALGMNNGNDTMPLSLPGNENRQDVDITCDSSPSLFSSQLAALSSNKAEYKPLTPTPTPSLYSHATSASELKEDSAIARLKQYAVSIRAKPDFGNPPILSHWPSVPGQDPAEYSWEKAQNAAANEEANESDHRSKKEEARRRRRTEKFLRQERARAAEMVLQPMKLDLGVQSGSQPEFGQNMFSSQPLGDLPQTQPHRGAFGTRTAPGMKKKQKKHRTAGF